MLRPHCTLRSPRPPATFQPRATAVRPQVESATIDNNRSFAHRGPVRSAHVPYNVGMAKTQPAGKNGRGRRNAAVVSIRGTDSRDVTPPAAEHPLPAYVDSLMDHLRARVPEALKQWDE